MVESNLPFRQSGSDVFDFPIVALVAAEHFQQLPCRQEQHGEVAVLHQVLPHGHQRHIEDPAFVDGHILADFQQWIDRTQPMGLVQMLLTSSILSA